MSAIVWATGIGTAGYFLGVTIEIIIEDIKHFERIILLGVAILELFIWGIRLLRRKNRIHKLSS